MPRSRLFRDDGSASLEFLVTGLLLLVPIVYLILVLAAVQSGSFAVEGAARQAARVFVESADASSGQAEAQRAVDVALADYGLHSPAATVTISCQPDPANCLARGGFVTVSIEAKVPMPLVPSGFGAAVPLAVPLSATSTDQVSRFSGAG